MTRRSRQKMSPAVVAGIQEEMRQDDDVFVMGEDVGEFGGIYESTDGLINEFGSDRVLDMPISETGFIGAGVGTALSDLRPVVELMYVDFSGVAWNQIYNEMAKPSYMSGGNVSVPMVLMTAVGKTPYQDPTHGQTLYGMFAHMPGMKVVVPSCPYDAKGLMQSAIRDDDPTVYMFHKQLMLGMFDFAEDIDDDAPAESYTLPIGEADIKRTGTDVTIVTLGYYVHKALKAAQQLETAGIDAEVLDLRSLVPLDEDAVIESVQKTDALLVVDEDYQSFGVSGEIITRATENVDSSFRASRLALPDTPVPYSPALKEELYPDVENIITAAQELAE